MLCSILLTQRNLRTNFYKEGKMSVSLVKWIVFVRQFSSFNILVVSVLAQYSRNPCVQVQVETQLITFCYMHNFNNYVHCVICMDLQPLDTTCSLKPLVQDDPTTRPASSLRLWLPPVAPVCGSGTICMAPTSIPSMSTPRVVDNWELQFGATQVNNGTETAHSTRFGWGGGGGEGGTKRRCRPFLKGN